jgi:hypothetical protein
MMEDTVEAKQARIQQVLALKKPDRLPCGDLVWVEYRPDVYHLGDAEIIPEPGVVAVSADGKRKYTRDGGVWAVGDSEKYRDYEDVLQTSPEVFEVEDVGPAMLKEMARLLANGASRGFAVPQHYGTLVTRAVIEFGWEPFLMAAAINPKQLGRLLDRFGAASAAVAKGWTQVEGAELISVHDDIAATRGPILHPDWYREYVFPWYRHIFALIHDAGRKVLYVSDGNYLPVLDDILDAGPDGLYIESTSMKPVEVMRRAGRDKLFLIKTDSRNIDFGTPEDIRQELMELRQLHEEFPGMMIYRGGGNPKPGNAEAFEQYYRELLVYE